MKNNPFIFEKGNLSRKNGVMDYPSPIKMHGFLIRPKKSNPLHHQPLQIGNKDKEKDNEKDTETDNISVHVPQGGGNICSTPPPSLNKKDVNDTRANFKQRYFVFTGH